MAATTSKSKKLTDDEVITRIKGEIRQSLGYDGGELSEQRRTALSYYYGDKFGNEQEGRSEYVSRDVAETIEWIMPSLMNIFYGADTIARFEPHGPEDEQVAQQATDYINYIFQRQNNGFLTLYSFLKDGLLAKGGFVKVYWEKNETATTETYEGLSMDELTQLMQMPNVEIVEQGMDEAEGITVKLRVTQNDGKCCVEPVPPEEMLISSMAVAPLDKNRFVAHRRKLRASEIREMGYEVPEGVGDEEGDFNAEKIERFSFDDNSQTSANENKDDANREVWFTECFACIDVDGDGIAERRRIVLIGSDHLAVNEEDTTTRFTFWTPIIIPHKLFGMSEADLVMDIQLLKSTIIRSILDNAYLNNNGRWMALDGMVNIDDLLVNRPGGIVRVKTFDAVKPIQPPLLGSPMFNLLEYVETIKENRSGVTRYNQGIDSNSLNKTASGVNQIMSASQQRIQLIARIAAETGIKDMFYAILECVQKHQDQPRQIRLRNQWVTMDPREWSNKFDISVTVGLGTGSKEMQLAGVQQVLQLQMGAMQMGLPIATPTNVYHSAIELVKAANLKGEDLFFTSPEQMPPAPPQSDPAMMEMEKAKMEAQTKMQVAEVGAKVDMEKIGAQMQTKMMTEQMKLSQRAQEDKITQFMDYQKHRDEMMLQNTQHQRETQQSAAQHQQTINVDAKGMSEAVDAIGLGMEKQAEVLAQIAQLVTAATQSMSESSQLIAKAATQMAKPKKAIRDKEGRLAGIE